MESNLDRMKRAAAANKPVPPPTLRGGPKPPPNRAAPAAPPKPFKPERVAVYVESVKHKCGHPQPAAAFAAVPCPACVGASRIERGKRRAAKRAAKPKYGDPHADAGGPEPGRLPAGAVKSLVWDGKTWAGMMTVPAYGVTVEAAAPTEKKCLHALHAAWLVRYSACKSGAPLGTPPPAA